VEWSNLFHWSGPPDRWRVHFPVADTAEESVVMSPERLNDYMVRFLPAGFPFTIYGSNLYTVHQRVAKKFRSGRAILCGDSAHVNSPIGAMGMNSGIHDAMNLADKLIAIVRGEVSDDVLDRYERQRRHVAITHTQAQTIRNKKTLAEKDPAVRRAALDELRRTSEDPKKAHTFLLRSSLIQSLREAEQIL
jgi:3-(3-hydroxy-phenyl)propionate hydroxylase